MIDQKKQRVIHSSLVLGLCTTLAACGGGGDINSTYAAAPSAVLSATSVVSAGPEATPVPLLVTTALATATPASALVTPIAVTDVICGLSGSNEFQAELLYRVNALRAVGAVCGSTIYRATGPLNWNNALLQAASSHSGDMASNNLFSHVGTDGSTLPTRYAAAGYGFSAAGENIAAGQSTVEEVMRSWINSPSHCQNLMNPTYQDVAVACKRNDATTYGLYWTMDLGRQ